MNAPRFPWRTAAALAATALLARWLCDQYRSPSQARCRTRFRPLRNCWHQVGQWRIFSRHGFPVHLSSGSPIVLVHGLGMSCDYFTPLAERLAVERPVHMPDLPGHGRSDTPCLPMSIPDKARALLYWMDSAGIGKAFLAGHSMGAQIAIEAARRQPQRFAGLVLIGPAHDPHAGLMLHAWRLLKAAPFERISLLGILMRDYLRLGWRFLPECLAMMRYPISSKVQRLSLPVMLMKGEYDAIVSDDWSARLVNATRAEGMLVIRGGGHSVHHSAPDKVANAMLAFLHRVETKMEDEGMGRN